jgi:hypothetical protein
VERDNGDHHAERRGVESCSPRRPLLAGLPPGEVRRITNITDRYLSGTRLRLCAWVWKQGETRFARTTNSRGRLPAPDGGPGLLSTIYLNEEEFAFLSNLPGSVLRKTRYSIPPFGVVVFDAPLGGLTLAECEFGDDVTMRSFIPPAWILAEVTFDARFSGGQLVTMSPADLPKLLSSFGVVVPKPD